MNEIPAGSVDLVLADLPYGTTKARWDSIIPLGPLWDQYRRILKPRGAVVLTACQPFTSTLVTSNRKWFRFDDVWDKVRTTGFLDAKRRPLRRHESIVLFAPTGRFTYNPQMRTGVLRSKNGPGRQSDLYGGYHSMPGRRSDQYYPTSIIVESSGSERGKVHPTQKPLGLMEYLVRTYSNVGDLVVDNAMGSGTTGVAALNLGRRFLGIERDPGYFDGAVARIGSAAAFHDFRAAHDATLLQA